ncbi:MAG: hypothetical protein CMJ46_11940 [Planctomyces sp.]|nr:hypothetical protein [Planctomyces sp.]
MLISDEYWDLAGKGVVQGIAYAFGTRLVNWMVSGWRGGGRGTRDNQQCFVRSVGVEELKNGVPEGHRLYCRDGEGFWELPVGEVPESIESDQSLWLIHEGEILLTAYGNDLQQGAEGYEVSLSIDPLNGLGDLIDEYGDEITVTTLGLAIASVFNRVLGATGTYPETLEAFKSAADTELGTQGIRCKSIRPIIAEDSVPTSAESRHSKPSVSLDEFESQREFDSLAAELNSVDSEASWKKLVMDPLERMNIPFDSKTRAELQRMQEEVIRRAISPETSVTRLAQLTEAALERAGISLGDLKLWRHSALRLDNDFSDLEDLDSAKTPTQVGVSTTKRPGTFWVWNRSEVDRRLLRYLRSITANGLHACNQGILRNENLDLARQLKKLEEQLELLSELIKTTPNLKKAVPGLRVDGKTAKVLVNQLNTAVRHGEKLNSHLAELLSQLEYDSNWEKIYSACLTDIDRLIFHVRERRNLYEV